MKTMHKNISTLLIILATLALLLVGCSDMMVKMGEIVLTIEAEDTIRTSVTKYKVTGSLEGSSKATIDLEVTMPANEAVVPNIAPGKWTFTVKAFDDMGEIGEGTQVINLMEGQKVELKVPVEFKPIQLTIIPNPVFVDTQVSKEYDGNTSLTFDGKNTYTVDATTLVGLRTDKGIQDSVLIEATATYRDKTAGANKTLDIVYTLIYSGDTDITGKYIAPDPYTVANGTILKKQLTISAPTFPDSKDRVYDGTDAIAVTAGSLIGVVDGDDVTVSATAAYSNKSAKDSKVITVTYTLGGSDAANYIEPIPNTTNRGTISQKLLSFTVTADDKVYDGDATAAGAIALAGVIGSDDGAVTATGTFTFSDKNAGSDKSVSVTNIALSGIEEANYVLDRTEASTTATITRKLLTNAGTTIRTKDYNQKKLAEHLIDHAKSGMVENDIMVLFADAEYETADAGTGKNVNIRYKYILGDDAGNYKKPADYTYTYGVIKPIQLTAGAPSFTKTRKTYDGTTSFDAADFSIATASLKGVYGTDVTLTATASYDNAQTSSGKDIRVSYSLINSDGNKANYIAPVDYITNTGVIEKKELTVTTADRAIETSKVYDGSLLARVSSHGTLEGLISIDDDVTLETRASYNDKSVLNGNIISVIYSISGSDSKNYSVKQPSDTETITATITRKPLKIYSDTTQIWTEKPYDGNTSAAVRSRGVLGGLAGSDGNTVTLTTTAIYQGSADAGTKGITVTYTLRGADASNYSAPEQDTTSFTGTIKPIQLTAGKLSVAATSKAYDGKTDLSVTTIVPDGFASGAMDVIATAAYRDKNVGTAKVVDVTHALKNANVNYLAPVSYTIYTGAITPLQLGINDPTITTNKPYNGDDRASIEAGDLNGILGSDDVRVVAEATYLSKNVGTSKITITYKLDGDDADNYTAPINTESYSGSITQKRLSVATDTTKLKTERAYDGTTNITVLEAGDLDEVVGNDVVTLSAEASFDDNADVGKDKPFTVTYTIAGSGASNYSEPVPLTSKSGEIKAVQLTINDPRFSNTSKTYDGTKNLGVEQGTLNGVVAKDQSTVAVSATAKYENVDVGVNKKITVSYALTEANANYLAPINNTITTGVITPKQLLISDPTFPKTLIKEYDGTDSVDFTMGQEVTGLYDPLDVTITASGEYLDIGIGTNKHIRITYSLTGAKAGNYRAPDSYLTTSGEITKKALKVGSGVTETTTVSQSKEYDGKLSAAVTRHGMPQGVVNNEDVVLTATATYNSTAVAADNIITVGYTLSGKHAGNYTAPEGYTIEAAAITKKQLTVKIGTTEVVTEKLSDEKVDVEVLNPGDLVGVIGNDAVTLGALATYSDTAVGTNKTITVVYSLSGADAENYTAPNSNDISGGKISTGQLTISNPTLVKTKVYNSTDECIVFPGIITEGIIGSDDVKVVAAATFNNKNAGTGKTITVTYSLTGRDARKYSKPANFITNDGEIQPKQLTITAPTGFEPDKQYDGNNRIVFTPGIVSGKCDNDTVNVISNGFYMGSTVGKDKQIFFNYTLTGIDAGNYIRPSYEISEGEIKPKVLTVKDGTTTIAGKVYDKTDSATVLEAGDLLGVVGREKVALSATATYNDVTAGTRNVTVIYSLSGVHADNYISPAVNSTDYTGIISKKQLIVDSQDLITSKVYNGTTAAVIADIDLGGIESGDTVTVSAIANYLTKDALTSNNDITVEYTLGDLDKNNYSKPANYTTVGTISQKQLTVDSQNLTTSKVYDGDTTAAITNVVLGGIVSDENVSINTAIATYNSKDTDTANKINTRYTLKGDDIGNYLKPVDKEIAGSISQKQLTIASQALTESKVYDGNTTAEITNVVLDGIVSNEDVSINTATAIYNSKDTDTANEITISYTLKGAHSGNYLKPVDKEIAGTISKKLLTIASQNLSTSKVYDGNATAKITNVVLGGIVSDEDVSINTATATYNSKDTDTANKITTRYTLEGAHIGNYLKPVDKEIVGSISQKQLTVTSQTLTTSKVYDGAKTANITDVVLGGIIPGDIVTGSAIANYSTKNASDTDKDITVEYTLGGSDKDNYSKPINYTAVGTISQKQLTVSGTQIDSRKGYDGKIDAIVINHGKLNEVEVGDDVRVSATANYLDANVSSTPKPIYVVYILTGGEKDNYIKPIDNTTDFTGTIEVSVDSPMFSLSSGSYVSNTPVSLSSTTDGATIRYTTDGSDPSQTNGTVYSGPFTIKASNTENTIKAIAYKSNFIDSSIARGNFTILKPTLTINPSSISSGNTTTTYNFTLTATAIPFGVAQVNFSWSFGDGSTANITVPVTDSSASTTILHRYGGNSVYGLAVIVSSGSTEHASAIASVTIGTPVARDEVNLADLGFWKAAGQGGFGLTADTWDISCLPVNCQFDLKFDTLGWPDRYIIEYPAGTVQYDSGWRGDPQWDGDSRYPGGVVGSRYGLVEGMFRKIDSLDPKYNKIKVTIIGGTSGTGWTYSMKARL